MNFRNRLLMMLLCLLCVGCSSSRNETDESTPDLARSISIETINYDDLPATIEEQISFIGCDFSMEKNGDSFYVNGLMKINGLYEMLQPVDLDNRKKRLFINENWELEIKISYTEVLGEGESEVFEGEGTLKSRSTGATKTFKVFGRCGMGAWGC